MNPSILQVIKERLIARLKRYLKLNAWYFPDITKTKKLIKYFYLKDLYNEIAEVPGNIVECGVAFGYSLIILGTLVKIEGKGRKVYGFDSFEGFPEPDFFDKSHRKTEKGQFGLATLERTKKIISKADIPEPILIKGVFNDTTKNFKGQIAFLHIDADLYQSYKVVLNNLFDKVSKGGVIAFDEYNESKWPGATKAIDEFLKLTGQRLRKSDYIDKYYIVKF